MRKPKQDWRGGVTPLRPFPARALALSTGCRADKRAKQKSDMRAIYIHAWSKQAQVDDEPAWVNPFHAQIFGIYTIGELNTQPTALVVAPDQKLELAGTNLVCCRNEARSAE